VRTSARPSDSDARPLPPPTAPTCTRYVARQPILDRELKTSAYELLFRSGTESFFQSNDPDSATLHVIDLSVLFGSAALTGGLRAFINCTRNVLLQDVITLLPRDRVVIEVLEDVLADEQTLAACDRLRRAGYVIALDDYTLTPNTLRLLPFADIVKVDLLSTDAARQAAIAAEMRRRGIRLLAEKVENRAQFDYARQLGYHYFQGYFFCRPQTLTMQDIAASKPGYMHVLEIANRESYEVSEMETAILREPSLCYRLLRYLNSAAFGLFPIRSVRHALSMLGQREIQKWIAIVVAISISSDRPGELISCALTRARCCELLASLFGEDSASAFMVGMLSLMDAILDRPMELVTAQLPINSACKEALRGQKGALGALLRVAVSCERGLWEELSAAADERGVGEEAILEIYRDACRWSSEILRENERPQ
jgi:EAL and modified HD-GYP domain-containing signal transduction protein